LIGIGTKDMLRRWSPRILVYIVDFLA